MTWNATESRMKRMIQTLGAGGDFRRMKLVEPFTVELNSVGIAQSIYCFADEFPEEFSDIADSLRFAAKFLELARPYRNHYVHGITGVTQYGIDFSDKSFDENLPAHEILVGDGPYALIHTHSAKSKIKWGMDFVKAEELSSFNNKIVDFQNYIGALHKSLNYYFNGSDFRKSAPLPPALPLPDALVKQVVNHPSAKEPPALDLDTLNRSLIERDEDEAHQKL